MATVMAAVVASCAALDVVAGGPVSPLRPVLWSAGLGVLVGGAVGLAVGLSLAALARAPRAARVLAWLLAGAVLAWWLIRELGVLARLEGDEQLLAYAALGGAATAGLGLAMAGLALQPSREQPAGALLEQPLRDRLTTLALLALLAGSLAWTDRRVEPDAYVAAHYALRWGTLAALVLAVLAAPRPRWRPSPRVRQVGVALLVLLVVAPFARLRARDRLALHAMIQRPFSWLVLEIARLPGDLDRDGHSAILGGGDCAPYDAAVHPSAPEIPDNGVDDNCRLGDARARPEADPDQAPSASARSPISVVLITVDTLRVDRMSLYGAKRDTTPQLASWAEGAIVFERAYSAASWTSLALPSLFYGLYPRRLRYTRVYETASYQLLRAPQARQLDGSVRIRAMFGLPLNETRRALPWWLQRRGMHTEAVVDDGRTSFLSAELGAIEGFDRYHEMDEWPARIRNDEGVTKVAKVMLKLVPPDRPFFFWAHYFGPHHPSTRHPDVREFGERVVDRYDHELLYNDRHLGELLAIVDGLAAKRPLAVIVTSDHGETIFERGRLHGRRLTEDVIRVPLLMKLPGQGGRRIEALASTVDVVPTVLALTETPPPASLDGVDLRTLLDEHPAPRILLSETWHHTADGELKRDKVAVFDGHHKLVANLLYDSRKLTRQDDSGGNLLGQVDAAALERVLEQYLEDNTVPLLSD